MAPAPEYVFTRDFIDNNRINLQHYLWVELFGYYTHPDIPIQQENLRIADVGTGTGIWLTDLARRLPSTTQLDGLDVSFDALPPSEWLPPNVTLRSWDIFQEPAEDLHGSYDVINIRNFSFVLKDQDIPEVLTRLSRLLKPGGYLQWSEPDVSSFRIEKTHSENDTTALTQLLRMSQAQDKRLSPTWVPKLVGLFEDQGLQQVQSDVRDAPLHLAIAMHECNLLIHELVVRKTKDADVANGLKTLIPKAAQETRDGSCWAFTRWNVIGKKPIQ